jgi:hypothetical protein
MHKPQHTNEDYAKYTLQLLKTLLRHRGEDTAITGAQLSDVLGIDTRIVAEIAGLLTAQGFWICSGNGYWYAYNEENWKEFQLNKERDRGIAIIRKTVAAKKNCVNEPTLFESVTYDRETDNILN